MKLSILTTITDPIERQDPWNEALACYMDLADELVIVNGGKKPTNELIKSLDPKVKWVDLYWPHEWNFAELPRHLNAGLKECTGDWVIKMDIDQIFHEKDFDEIRRRLSNIFAPVMTFQKYTVMPFRKFIQKGEMVLAINKGEHGDKIQFGEAVDEKTDLCRPIWVTGNREISSIYSFGHDYKYKIPVGETVRFEEAGRTGVSYWNFDYTFRTEDFAKKEFWRFARAYKRFYGSADWGNTEEESWKVFINMMKSRLQNAIYYIEDLDILPKYIRERYSRLTEKEFGHSGWGLL